jgi:hypothetical protein
MVELIIGTVSDDGVFRQPQNCAPDALIDKLPVFFGDRQTGVGPLSSRLRRYDWIGSRCLEEIASIVA